MLLPWKDRGQLEGVVLGSCPRPFYVLAHGVFFTCNDCEQDLEKGLSFCSGRTGSISFPEFTEGY